MMPPKQAVFVYPSLLMTLVYMQQIAKKVVFLESCSAASIQWRRGVRARTLKLNEEKTEAMYFSSRPTEDHLALNGWNIPFANKVKYLGVFFDIRIT
jgi:hypothetical protein